MPEELRHACCTDQRLAGVRCAGAYCRASCTLCRTQHVVPASDERTHVPASLAVAEHGSTATRLTKHAREPKADGVWAARGAEVRRWAQGALQFVERTATERAGKPATARTVCLCGVAGTVAYSMIGARSLP